jgi:hypothetical protein
MSVAAGGKRILSFNFNFVIVPGKHINMNYFILLILHRIYLHYLKLSDNCENLKNVCKESEWRRTERDVNFSRPLSSSEYSSV